jgi:hypothetical protein
LNLRLQATYFRTGLLLGIVRGDEVHRWAEEVIGREVDPPHALIDLSLVDPDDLSEMRHALWPLCVDPEPEIVLESVLALLHRDLEARRLDLATTVTILRQMRSMLRLPRELYRELNATLVGHASIGVTVSPVPAWLERFAHATLESPEPER